MKYDAIIFDFDGVLFDSEKIHLYACNQIFEKLGITISDAEYFKYYVGLPDNDMFDLIMKKHEIQCTAKQINSLKRDKITEYKNYITRGHSLNGVAGVKDFIQSHCKIFSKIAICSNATREEIDATLEKLENGNLKRFFELIISIDDVDKGKPSPACYLLAAKRLEVLPQKCLVIEDTLAGIMAAKSAGMTVIGITTSHDKATLKDADYVATSYAEIKHWLTASQSLTQ